ncbi:MAG: methyltransferase domain-containing protein [Chloroflexi bacterium]|nr:methyltransferase domain-containing protein [Chloroflexota bacterium]
MEHADHLALLRPAVVPGGTWADLGSNTGAFTLALAELLRPAGTIWSVDRDARSLETQAARLRGLPAGMAARVLPLVGDFTRPLALPPLDGVVMANSLHFVRDPVPLLARLVALLRPGGRFVLVEYDADRGNHWVPHPISSERWPAVAAAAGLCDVREIGRRGSRFLNAIYSAVAVRPGKGVASRA